MSGSLYRSLVRSLSGNRGTIATSSSCYQLNKHAVRGSSAIATYRLHSTASFGTRDDINTGNKRNSDSIKQKKHFDGLTNGRQPKLVRVPSFPIVGSLIPQLSGIPRIDPLTRGYDFWLAMQRQYGEFYSMGSPAGGRPDDIYRTQYIINDPREAVKVVRAGGQYPSGVLEILWVNRRWGKMRGLETTAGLFGRGKEWQRVRRFFQTDLLHPEAARGYVPGIIEAAERASRGAKAAASLRASGDGGGDDKALNLYLSRSAFDMFSSMMMGEYTETADVTTPTDPLNERFVNGAVDGLSEAIQILFSPYEMIVGKLMGFETARMRKAFAGFDTAWEIAQDKIESFTQRKEKGMLTENEQVSYLSRALDRQKEEGSNVSVRDVQELAFTGLFAAVDTTSSMLGWNLVHVARLPDVQEKLHDEISSAVESVGGGRLSAEALSKSNAPYLHALVRETHRLTPTGAINLSKTVDVDGLEIHGRTMKEGDVVVLEGYSVGMDPELVDEPHQFRPERWLQAAVDSRKGTLSEVIDHPFLNGPFSQGARKCPGSRVAMNEIHIFLSQLVLDWKMSTAVTSLKDITYQQHTTIEANLPAIEFEARR